MPAAAIALAPLGWLYGAVVGARGRLYDAGWLGSRALPVPVLSVGNLTVGGSGKSPMTAHVAGLLQRRGLRPAIVSRGYRGGHAGSATIVSEGKGCLVDAAVAGDEPVMLARMLEGVPVIVSRRRYDGGLRAVEACGAACIVLDDGFQHRALRRDLDLLLVDAEEGLDGGRLLPAGRLREPVRGMSRADAVVIMVSASRAAGGRAVPEILEAASRYCPRAPIFRASTRPAGLIEAAGGAAVALDKLRGARAACFAGIAHPDRFFADVEAAGAQLVARLPFGDHHPFSPADLQRVAAEAAAARADILLTTMKDLARLGSTGLPGLHAMTQELLVEQEESFAGLLVAAAS